MADVYFLLVFFWTVALYGGFSSGEILFATSGGHCIICTLLYLKSPLFPVQSFMWFKHCGMCLLFKPNHSKTPQITWKICIYPDLNYRSNVFVFLCSPRLQLFDQK